MNEKSTYAVLYCVVMYCVDDRRGVFDQSAFVNVNSLKCGVFLFCFVFWVGICSECEGQNQSLFVLCLSMYRSLSINPSPSLVSSHLPFQTSKHSTRSLVVDLKDVP